MTVESGNARFIENGSVSGSVGARDVEIRESLMDQNPSNDPSQIEVPIIVAQPQGMNMEQQQMDALSLIMDAIIQEEEENAQVNEQVRPQEEIVSRRSTREKRSAISNDYIVYALEHESDLNIDNDQVSFDQAMSGENSDKWLMAMKEELKSMDDNNVWEMTELPKDSKRVGCKWVFKTKRDFKGNVERYKARLVAKGYTPKDGNDYKETFSPVSRKDSLRIVMALVAHFDLELHQMDVKTAFLNGDLEEEVYMDQPQGFETTSKRNPVCRLKKSIYGLKQASRQWYLKFDDTVLSYGFVEMTVDRCIYMKVVGSKFIILVFYVDDILLAASDRGLLHDVKNYLSSNFEMKDMSEASYVIGIEIFRDRSQGILEFWDYLKRLTSTKF